MTWADVFRFIRGTREPEPVRPPEGTKYVALLHPPPNRRAFLDMIAYSEIGPELLAVSDNGYNVVVGSTAAHPDLFDSYADHPRARIWIPKYKIYSTAAGRYQLLSRYFDAYRDLLNLPDFSPASQDAIALQQIKEQRALALIDSGDFDAAVDRVSNIWASLPGSLYGQHTNNINSLRAEYVRRGGYVA
jgi:muramidase (phage lysozyme)